MSTRCTISYDDAYHLYEECFDNNNIYLELDGSGWDAALSTRTVDWRDGDTSRPRVGIKMDVTLWRKIVDGWMKSQWAANPDRDHASIVNEEWNPPEWMRGNESSDDK